MDESAAIPLVIPAKMIFDKYVSKKGIFTPEKSFDAEEFLSRYTKYCAFHLSLNDVIIKKIW